MKAWSSPFIIEILVKKKKVLSETLTFANIDKVFEAQGGKLAKFRTVFKTVQNEIDLATLMGLIKNITISTTTQISSPPADSDVNDPPISACVAAIQLLKLVRLLGKNVKSPTLQEIGKLFEECTSQEFEWNASNLEFFIDILEDKSIELDSLSELDYLQPKDYPDIVLMLIDEKKAQPLVGEGDANPVSLTL